MSTAAETTALPTLLDPWSRMGDEIAGDSPDAIAINFGEVARLSQLLRCPLVYPAPNLRRTFRGQTLSEEAKRALRRADQILQNTKPLTPHPIT